MPTLTQVRNRVDDWLIVRWPLVQARQSAYFTAHERYWQGLKTASVEPEHTTAVYANAKQDRLTVKPTDQAEAWLDFLVGLDDLAIPAALVMDVYDGPHGHGYVTTVIARYNGTIYSRSQNVGPEKYRIIDWHVVEGDGFA